MARLRQIGAGLWLLMKKYPVRAQGIVVSLLAVATAFGLGWSAQQVGAVVGLTAATLSFFTEQAVTSMERPNLPVGTDVNGGAAVVASKIPPEPPVAVMPPDGLPDARPVAVDADRRA